MISAFPMAVPENWDSIQDGMTLRDWFAGQALASGTYTDSDDVWMSEQCYIIADAMIAERNGQ